LYLWILAIVQSCAVLCLATWLWLGLCRRPHLVEEVTAEAAPENGWVVSSGEAEKDLCSNPRGPEEAVWGGVAITPALTPPPPPGW
jgi:hypothetical protein